MKSITLAFMFILPLLLGGCVGLPGNTGSTGGGTDTSDAASNASSDNQDDDTISTSGDDSPKSCLPVAPSPWPEADIADPSVIAFDEDLFFTVDGTRFFPLGFYYAPTDAAGLAEFKSEGFNIALTGPGCCDGTTRQDQIDFLTRARDAGVFAILYPWTPIEQVMTRTDEELAADLDARTGVGSLFGWYTFDEPGLNFPPKELTSRVHQVLAEYDPDHLDTLVEAPLSSFSQFMDDCAFFMVDPYPSNWMPLAYIKAVVQEAEAATQGLKPVVGVMQAFSWDRTTGVTDSEFHPDGLEMRNMAWQFIIQGARGLLPWNYAGDYTIRFQPEIWASFLDTTAEINDLKRLILSNDATVDLAPSCSFPTLFDYQAKRDGTTLWVFTVSSSDRWMKVGLDLSNLDSTACVVDYTTGETFAADAEGKISVSYDPLQVRLFEIPGG